MTSTRKTALAAIIVALPLVASCTLSEDSKSIGGKALCAAIGSTEASLAATAEGAKALASIVSDNVDDPTVRNVAERVAKNPHDGVARKALSEQVAKYCP